MDTCLQSRPVSSNMPELYDLQYFYVDANHIGQYTCGVAFETMMSLFRRHRLSLFCGQEWYSAVQRSSGNPVVQGFLAEHICLSQIMSSGLCVVSSVLGRMEHTTFEDIPNWDNQLSSGHTIRLYIPTVYNFRAVDAVILHLDRNAKSAHLYPIQITLSKQHRQSDHNFYEKMWFNWIKPMENIELTVESTFVWIDKKQPGDDVVPQKVRILRKESKIIRPAYSSVHVGIQQVDEKLSNSLGL
jgi:hypothetical protein